MIFFKQKKKHKHYISKSHKPYFFSVTIFLIKEMKMCHFDVHTKEMRMKIFAFFG